MSVSCKPNETIYMVLFKSHFSFVEQRYDTQCALYMTKDIQYNIFVISYSHTISRALVCEIHNKLSASSINIF